MYLSPNIFLNITILGWSISGLTQEAINDSEKAYTSYALAFRDDESGFDSFLPGLAVSAFKTLRNYPYNYDSDLSEDLPIPPLNLISSKQENSQLGNVEYPAKHERSLTKENKINEKDTKWGFTKGIIDGISFPYTLSLKSSSLRGLAREEIGDIDSALEEYQAAEKSASEEGQKRDGQFKAEDRPDSANEIALLNASIARFNFERLRAREHLALDSITSVSASDPGLRLRALLLAAVCEGKYENEYKTEYAKLSEVKIQHDTLVQDMERNAITPQQFHEEESKLIPLDKFVLRLLKNYPPTKIPALRVAYRYEAGERIAEQTLREIVDEHKIASDRSFSQERRATFKAEREHGFLNAVLKAFSPTSNTSSALTLIYRSPSSAASWMLAQEALLFKRNATNKNEHNATESEKKQSPTGATISRVTIQRKNQKTKQDDTQSNDTAIPISTTPSSPSSSMPSTPAGSNDKNAMIKTDATNSKQMQTTFQGHLQEIDNIPKHILRKLSDVFDVLEENTSTQSKFTLIMTILKIISTETTQNATQNDQTCTTDKVASRTQEYLSSDKGKELTNLWIASRQHDLPLNASIEALKAAILAHPKKRSLYETLEKVAKACSDNKMTVWAKKQKNRFSF